MIIAVCVDDKMGMLFNHRRQSHDKFLIDDLMNITEKVHINSFSQELFGEYADKIEIDENFLENAAENDVCFVENIDLEPYSDKINKVILYLWNRHYPSTLKFKVDLSDYNFIESTEFEGNSHEKITREVYSK